MLVQVTTPNGVFGIEVKDGIIVETAPIGDWLIGKQYYKSIAKLYNYQFEELIPKNKEDSYITVQDKTHKNLQKLERIKTMQLSGTVFFANTNKWTNPKGEVKTLYSIKLDGDDRYINFGEENPNLVQGDVVEITTTTDAKGKIRAKAAAVTKKGKADVSSPKRTASPRTQARDDYWSNKDAFDKQMIPEYRYREASRQAVAMLELLNDIGALKGVSGSSATAQKKYDAVMAMRKNLTESLAEEFDEANLVSKPKKEEKVDEFPDVEEES